MDQSHLRSNKMIIFGLSYSEMVSDKDKDMFLLLAKRNRKESLFSPGNLGRDSVFCQWCAVRV